MNVQMRPPTPSPPSPTTTRTATAAAATTLSLEELKRRLRQLGLYGLLAHAEELLNEPWLARLLEIEESERLRRSLKRRLDGARLGSFKPMADFDYQWPKQLDRSLLDELFTLEFLEQAANIIVVGPNGLGKSMIAKNLLHQALLRGYTARFTAASDMLHDLAAQDSSTQLARRLRRYTTPAVLCCDEVGYLAYDTRYADLLFEVVTRRYQLRRPLILTTNRTFSEWNQIFPNATCVVALIDRLVHRSEILSIDGESYRLKEAKERAAKRAAARSAAKKSRTASR
ncbi:MAG: IS21-like element helper ATPase IstB [Steroidobacteraceae bacterium]